MLSLCEVLSITIAVWKCLTWHSDIMIAHKCSPTEEWVGGRDTTLWGCVVLYDECTEEGPMGAHFHKHPRWLPLMCPVWLL